MKKSDLVDRIVNKKNINRKQAEAVINTILQNITDSLAGGDKVAINGFGSFHVREKNARICHLPKTGERIEVPAKKVPVFRAGKDLREIVNGGGYNLSQGSLSAIEIDKSYLPASTDKPI